MSPFIAVHHRGKSVVLRTDRRIVLRSFSGATARRRAEEWLQALLVGWFSNK
jgi:hypothetical protein